VGTAAALLLLLAACGHKGELMPKQGNALPPAPYWAAAPKPTPQMLERPADAAPVRVDDLIRRPEQERPRDPFDLPPKQ
jgi:hypothetical protein